MTTDRQTEDRQTKLRVETPARCLAIFKSVQGKRILLKVSLDQNSRSMSHVGILTVNGPPSNRNQMFKACSTLISGALWKSQHNKVFH